MFGGSLEPPKLVKRSRPNPMIHDIQLPMISPGVWGHVGRQPNTDQHVKLLHYKQRIQHSHDEFLEAEAKRLKENASKARYDRRTESKVFQRLVRERFQEKLEDYEASVEARRAKLRQLLCQEEQDFIRETIEQAQKGVDNKLSEMKMKAQLLKAKREAERQKMVEEKRIQQYMNSCQELRPVVYQRNLIDSKMSQLQQIEEKKMRKEVERELDHLWYDLMTKELEAKKEREVQDMLKQNRTKAETLTVWEKQIEGKKLLKEEEEKIAAEDRMEMVKLQEQLRREQIEALDAKRRKRDQIAKELMAQVRIQEEVVAQRKKEEDALNNALNRMAEEEVAREREKIQNLTEIAKRERLIYRNHLKELEEERKLEEVKLNELLTEHRKAIEKKQEEARCKLIVAREALQKRVLEGRAQQLEYKRQEAENQLKLKEAENELCRMACETNERLQAEHDRRQAELIRQYRQDLQAQIEYNNEKRNQEKMELDRELKAGLEEEERQRRKVEAVMKMRVESEEFMHPFRKVMEKPGCPCPK